MSEEKMLEEIYKGMQELRQEIADVKSELRQEIADVKSELRQGMEETREAARKDSAEIKLILENEIRENIKRIAEGHLDLSRNVHELIRPNSEMEMLAIRVKVLETEMKEVKQMIF